ncbi:unnamed protein product, partial [Staurois parvus]
MSCQSAPVLVHSFLNSRAADWSYIKRVASPHVVNMLTYLIFVLICTFQ